MKVYIAGQITNNPNYIEIFARAEEALVKKGHKVMNPAKLPQGFTQAEYMRICFSMIEACEAVLFLSNWVLSEGAAIEMAYATKVEKLIYRESQGELIAW